MEKSKRKGVGPKNPMRFQNCAENQLPVLKNDGLTKNPECRFIVRNSLQISGRHRTFKDSGLFTDKRNRDFISWINVKIVLRVSHQLGRLDLDLQPPQI